MSPVVLESHTTREVLEGKKDPQQYLDAICSAVATLEKSCDFLIIEGAGHTGVGSVMGLNNAKLARQLNAPVLLVAGGGVGNVIDSIELNLALFRENGSEVRMILPNKLIKSKREATLKYLQLAFKGTAIQISGGFNYSPILANPTLTYVADLLGLDLQSAGDQGHRIVHHVQLGAASTQRVIDLLQESTLVIVPSSRDEVLVMLSTLYHLPGFKEKIAGLIINGLVPLAEIVQRVIDDAEIPYMRTPETMANLYTTMQQDVAKIGADDREKITLVQQLAEANLDFEFIDSLF
jgi:BioD-like phosphotransacetylase family protein